MGRKLFVAGLVFLLWPLLSAGQLNILNLLKEDLNPPPAILVKTKPFRPPPSWFSCRADRDCVHIDFYCAESVVNKRYYSRALEYYNTRNLGNRCTRRAVSPRREPPYKVYCQANRCRRQGINPNPPIFSEFSQEQIGENIFIRNSRNLKEGN